MKHIVALIVKFIMVTIILQIVLNLMTALNFWEILLISLVVTALAYIIGDLIILPLTNNTIATVSDAGIALLTIYLFNFAANFAWISFISALVSAVIIGAGEWFFHKYVVGSVLKRHTKER